MAFTVLVFPCGSEVGLEIHASLRYSTHFNLIGASSVADHGQFVYEDYIGTVPFINDDEFLPVLKNIITERKVDAIYPAMDQVAYRLANLQEELKCKVITSSVETLNVIFSKRKTYERLENAIQVPKVYNHVPEQSSFPVFVKPDQGYGSRGAKKIVSQKLLDAYFEENGDAVVMELLTGKEYTIDCFTDRKRDLLFIGPRPRSRVSNGISVNTSNDVMNRNVFEDFANKINKQLALRGAWFFQVKENKDGEIVLLEVASRIAGSSAIYRMLGVNFALLTLFDAFDFPVSSPRQSWSIESDRALQTNYSIGLKFETVYVDLDDTLIIRGKVNARLVSLLFQFINQGKKIILITKHSKNINDTLEQHRLNGLFDQVILLEKESKKTEFIKDANSIFIDDSFAERNSIMIEKGIPVFAPDAIDCLFEKMP